MKAVDLPQEMQRAMAKQAESEREKRAKIIHASGELEASKQLAEAASALQRAAGRRCTCATCRRSSRSRPRRTRRSSSRCPIDWMKALMGRDEEGAEDGRVRPGPAGRRRPHPPRQHRGHERPRAAEVGARQRRDGRPDLPQGRRHQERPPAHGPRRLRRAATTPTSASARTCCCAGKITRPPVPRGQPADRARAGGSARSSSSWGRSSPRT